MKKITRTGIIYLGMVAMLVHLYACNAGSGHMTLMESHVLKPMNTGMADTCVQVEIQTFCAGLLDELDKNHRNLDTLRAEGRFNKFSNSQLLTQEIDSLQKKNLRLKERVASLHPQNMPEWESMKAELTNSRKSLRFAFQTLARHSTP